MKNALDPREYRNSLAGTTARPSRSGNPLTRPAKWFSKSSSPLGVETGRLGLVYRSLEDGKNLIESTKTLIDRIEKEA